MPRVKIQKPDYFSFKTTISIRITDVNYGGHVGNDSILSLLHEARLQYLNSLGFSEMSVDGAALIMADVAIEFKKEIFYGTAVTAHVQAAEFSRTGFDIFYQLLIHSNEEEQIAVLAKTGMVCFDYETRRVKPLTEAAIQKLHG